MQWFATYGSQPIGAVQWTMRIANPHSILSNFDNWFAFECRANGLAEFDPDDYPGPLF